MKNWLSKLLANVDEVSQTGLRVNLVLVVASLMSLPLYVYLALQSGAWQMYVVLATVIVFVILSLIATSFAVRNHGRLSMAIAILSLAAVIPIVVAMISGVGIVLAVADLLIFAVISGQTLMGERTQRALIIGVVSTVVTLAVDLYASWERVNFPVLQTYLPIIATLALGALSIFTMRQFTAYSLRTKLIVGFLLVTLIPLGATFYLNSRNTRQILTNDANIALSSASAAVADNVDGFIAEGLTDVRDGAKLHILQEYLALSPAQRSGSETETVLYQDLRAIAQKDPIYITSVGLMDVRGIDVADTYSADINLDKSTRVWFTTPFESGLPYLSPTEFSEALGQYSLYFSAPVRNLDGKIIGALRIRYNADVLQKIVVSAAENANIPDSFLVLLDENHIRMAHSSDPDLILKSVVPLPLDKLAQLQESRRLPLDKSAEELSTNIPELETGINNVDNQSIFSADFVASGKGLDEASVLRLKNQPWVIVSVQPIDTFLAPVQEQTRASALLALLIAALVATAGFFVAQTLSAPIVRLTHVAEQVAAGNNNIQAEVASQDEIGTLAGSFNTMTAKLREFIATLEERVAERTRNLELAAEVGRSVSQVRKLDVMLSDAAELIRSQFNLYYVQVYLTDRSQTNLLLLSGTGKVGEQLVGRSHRLPLNTGSINGRAATEKKSVVIADTTTSATFRPNPLLPDTHSEMAVPLIVGEKVVGVLDLQSENANALTQELLPAFEALAGQLAIAIQNANLLAETEQARAEVEAQARRLVRANWADYMDAVHKPEETSFVFEQNRISAATQDEAIKENSLISPISVTGETLGNLVVELSEGSQGTQTAELVNTIAQQVAQHIESLRLLESAERYRAESEQASRRLTREGWKTYMEANTGENLSYLYDLKEVRPYSNGDKHTEDANYVLPLKVRDETVGRLAVEGLTTDDRDSLELANAVAERLSAHIESLRQADQTQSALAQSEKLFDASRGLTQATDLQELVLAAVTTLNISVVNRALLAVFNYAPDSKMEGMRVAANWWSGTGHEATAVGTYYSSEALKVLSIFTSPTPIFFNDMYNDKRVDAASLEVVKRLNVRAMVGLPLFVGPRQIGTLILEAEEVHNFSQEDIRLFTALAPQIATLLESRRQFERAQEQAKREAMLNTINQKIQSATSVEAVLQIAARELGHALGAPMTVAQLSMKDKAS